MPHTHSSFNDILDHCFLWPDHWINTFQNSCNRISPIHEYVRNGMFLWNVVEEKVWYYALEWSKKRGLWDLWLLYLDKQANKYILSQFLDIVEIFLKTLLTKCSPVTLKVITLLSWGRNWDLKEIPTVIFLSVVYDCSSSCALIDV